MTECSDSSETDLIEQLDAAQALRRAGRFADAVAILEQVLAGCERGTLAGNDLWLEAQSLCIACLGSDGAAEHRLMLARFESVRADFEADLQHAERPDAAHQMHARIRFCELARQQIRSCCALGRFGEALEAADYANELHAAIPPGIERSEQRILLLAECAGVLHGLGNDEDAELLAAEAVEILGRRWNDAASAAGDVPAELANRERIRPPAQILLRRVEDMNLRALFSRLAQAHLSSERRMQSLDPDAAPRRLDLARANESVGMAAYRLGLDGFLDYLTAAADGYRSLIDEAGAMARAHLARLMKVVAGLHDGRSDGEARRALRESVQQLRILWQQDPVHYGPAYLDVLNVFCTSLDGRAHLDQERRDVLRAAEQVIEGFDEPQMRECAALVEQIRGAATATELPAAGAAPAPPRVRTRRRQRRSRRKLIVASAIIVLSVLGLLLGLVLYDSGPLHCVELALDPNGEEICARWENRSGVSRSVLPADELRPPAEGDL